MDNLMRGSYGKVSHDGMTAAYKRIPLVQNTRRGHRRIVPTNIVDAAVSAAVCRLQLPNVVWVHAVYMEDGDAEVSMELGYMSLHRYITMSNANRSVYTRLRYAMTALRCLVRGLHALHTHGIVHGDVKPENVIVTQCGPLDLKLVDFGGALTKMSRGGGYVNVSGRCTNLYAAPEQFFDEPCNTAEADAYSLGAVMYYYIYGRHVFEEGNASVENMKKHHTTSADGGVVARVRELARSRWWKLGRLDAVMYACHEHMAGLLHPDPAKRTTIASLHAEMFGASTNYDRPGAGRAVVFGPASRVWTCAIDKACAETASYPLNCTTASSKAFAEHVEQQVAPRHQGRYHAIFGAGYKRVHDRNLAADGCKIARTEDDAMRQTTEPPKVHYDGDAWVAMQRAAAVSNLAHRLAARLCARKSDEDDEVNEVQTYARACVIIAHAIINHGGVLVSSKTEAAIIAVMVALRFDVMG
jgi:serine/threonine protein kinase